MARKETTVKEADAKAAGLKSAKDCQEGIIAEAMKLYKGEEHSMQQMLAYCRQMEKLDKRAAGK